MEPVALKQELDADEQEDSQWHGVAELDTSGDLVKDYIFVYLFISEVYLYTCLSEVYWFALIYVICDKMFSDPNPHIN